MNSNQPEKTRHTWSFFGAALAVSLGLACAVFGSVFVASRTYSQSFAVRAQATRKAESVITITGSARKRIRSDLGIWRFTLSSEGKELKSGYQVLQEATVLARKFLQEHGFAAADIAMEPVQTEETFKDVVVGPGKGRLTKESTGFRLHRSFVITTRDLERLAPACGEITSMIGDGYQVSANAPEYHYTGLADLKLEMTGLASKNARERADQIAHNAGAHVAEIRTARLGVFQITRPESGEVSDSGVCDTSSIEKDITAVVTFTLGLEMDSAAQ